jgi:hypothetical protein
MGLKIRGIRKQICGDVKADRGLATPYYILKIAFLKNLNKI